MSYYLLCFYCLPFCVFIFFFFLCLALFRDLHSFPTRRSSDLRCSVPTAWCLKYFACSCAIARTCFALGVNILSMYNLPFNFHSEVDSRMILIYGHEVDLQSYYH